MFTLSCHLDVFLWKLLRSASLRICRELQMRGWKEEVMKDLAHFQFVSLTTCGRTLTVTAPGQNLEWPYSRELGRAPGWGPKACGELVPWGRRWWQQQLSYIALWQGGQALATTKQFPVAFSSKVKMGGTCSTTGEVAIHRAACKLSTQPALRRTRHPGVCADWVWMGVMNSSWASPHHRLHRLLTVPGNSLGNRQHSRCKLGSGHGDLCQALSWVTVWFFLQNSMRLMKNILWSLQTPTMRTWWSELGWICSKSLSPLTGICSLAWALS